MILLTLLTIVLLIYTASAKQPQTSSASVFATATALLATS